MSVPPGCPAVGTSKAPLSQPQIDKLTSCLGPNWQPTIAALYAQNPKPAADASLIFTYDQTMSAGTGYLPGGVLPGQNPKNIPGGPQIQAGVGSVWSAITSVPDFLNKLWSVISNHVFWLRLLEGIIGVVMLNKGLQMVTGSSLLQPPGWARKLSPIPGGAH